MLEDQRHQQQPMAAAGEVLHLARQQPRCLANQRRAVLCARPGTLAAGASAVIDGGATTKTLFFSHQNLGINPNSSQIKSNR
jgi:hypothetical protein